MSSQALRCFRKLHFSALPECVSKPGYKGAFLFFNMLLGCPVNSGQLLGRQPRQSSVNQYVVSSCFNLKVTWIPVRRLSSQARLIAQLSLSWNPLILMHLFIPLGYFRQTLPGVKNRNIFRKELSKHEAKFAEGKKNMNSLVKKLQ